MQKSYTPTPPKKLFIYATWMLSCSVFSDPFAICEQQNSHAQTRHFSRMSLTNVWTSNNLPLTCGWQLRKLKKKMGRGRGCVGRQNGLHGDVHMYMTRHNDPHTHTHTHTLLCTHLSTHARTCLQVQVQQNDLKPMSSESSDNTTCSRNLARAADANKPMTPTKRVAATVE